MPNRVEREIEEILSKLEPERPAGRAPIRLRRSWRSRTTRNVSRWRSRVPAPPHINPGSMMLAGILLILSAFFLRSFSDTLTRWVVILGLILFFASFILSFWPGARSGPAGGDVYWRGERIARSDLRGPSLPARVQQWWRRRNRRRW
jgi:hypothetical protein